MNLFLSLGCFCVCKTMCFFKSCCSNEVEVVFQKMLHTVCCHADLGSWLQLKALPKKKQKKTNVMRLVDCTMCLSWMKREMLWLQFKLCMFLWNRCSPWKWQIRCDQASFYICTDFCYDLLKLLYNFTWIDLYNNFPVTHLAVMRSE